MAYTTIDDPGLYFNTVIFTGDGTDNRAISVGFQPDLVWNRMRTDDSGGYITDSIRGNNAALQTTNGNGEGTFASMTFTSTGITVSGNDNVNNEDAHNFVLWNWKAGGSASTNENGSVDTSVSVNQDAGFSICTYTGNDTDGATFGHGLGAIPSVVLIKQRDATRNWYMKHKSLSSDYNISLDQTIAQFNASSYNAGIIDDLDNANTWSVTKGAAAMTNNNADGGTYVAYCFAEKQGYSKFGSYTGNGNADGTFVYTGFRPAFVMTKSMDSTSAWEMFDNKREGYNVDNDALVANAVTAEATADQIDLLSNGFKLRIATDPNVAETYIYMAFAENPFVSSSGVPATAR